MSHPATDIPTGILHSYKITNKIHLQRFYTILCISLLLHKTALNSVCNISTMEPKLNVEHSPEFKKAPTQLQSKSQ